MKLRDIYLPGLSEHERNTYLVQALVEFHRAHYLEYDLEQLEWFLNLCKDENHLETILHDSAFIKSVFFQVMHQFPVGYVWNTCLKMNLTTYVEAKEPQSLSRYPFRKIHELVEAERRMQEQEEARHGDEQRDEGYID